MVFISSRSRDTVLPEVGSYLISFIGGSAESLNIVI